MLVPLSWLREFTPYEGTAQALGDKLTMLGLELEGLSYPFADIADVKVGLVAQCLAMPDSEHLHVCKVDIGEPDLLDIVCGAPNVAAGQKVVVAPVGCKLPNNLTIKKAKLRGYLSCGMICSERELGLSEDHSGIMVLPETAKVGDSLTDALGLDTEVLDISITPNRADCLSVLGIARETATAYHLPFKVPELSLTFANDLPELSVPVHIAEADLCWLYSGRVVSGVTVKQSPLNIRCRLIAVGVRPISNIVDVTNYVLFECGQPLHAFDLDKLAGGRIITHTAKEGEKFTTLDGKERTLTSHDLCICDAEKIVGLAGVMGGLNTEITDTSKNVFIEGAVFRPQSIRKTSRRLGLTSEASYRFERGVDQMRTFWAVDRAADLIARMSGGQIRKGSSYVEPKPFAPAQILYHPAKSNELLGIDLSNEFQYKTLQALGCGMLGVSDKEFIAIQPSWRSDLTREADLIEEVGRMYGLDSIEPKLPPVEHNIDDDFTSDTPFAFWNKIKRWGAGIGLNECVNYSFVGDSDLDFLNLPKTGRISIFNPLSEEQNVLRVCITPGLLKDLSNNLAFGVQSLHLFELANVFCEDQKSETTVREQGRLGILLYGLRHESGWPRQEADMDYADLKGIFENLLYFLHLGPAKYLLKEKHPYLAPCVKVTVADQDIGVMGKVKPEIGREYNAQKDIWIGEYDLEILREMHRKVNVQFKPLPVYPAVKRDMTVMAQPAVKVDEILENILAMRLPLLEGAVLIDCFEPAGQDIRNLTFRLTFRHGKRTLKDVEVDKEREKVAAALRKNLGVEI